ncbi:MAG: PilZ domain-containing protein [Methylophagaceae bacterium]
MHTVNSNERRGAVRIDAQIDVRFTVNGNHDVSHQGSGQNLSTSGLYMTTTFSPRIGDDIALLMSLDGKRLQQSITEGIVVRSRFDKKDNKLFHVSVAFSEPLAQLNSGLFTANNLF